VQLILEHPVECEQASTVYMTLVLVADAWQDRHHMIAKRQHSTDTNRI